MQGDCSSEQHQAYHETWHCAREEGPSIDSIISCQQASIQQRSALSLHGMVWYRMVWYGMVWCGVVWCGVVWCGVVWCGVVWCGVVWCGVVWCGVVWYGMVWSCTLPVWLINNALLAYANELSGHKLASHKIPTAYACTTLAAVACTNLRNRLGVA